MDREHAPGRRLFGALVGVQPIAVSCNCTFDLGPGWSRAIDRFGEAEDQMITLVGQAFGGARLDHAGIDPGLVRRVETLWPRKLLCGGRQRIMHGLNVGRIQIVERHILPIHRDGCVVSVAPIAATRREAGR